MADLRADFEIISFQKHLGDKAGDLNTSAKFVGGQTTEKKFNIGKKPSGPGYITLQLYDVHSSGHHIIINGRDLPGMDIPRQGTSERWYT